MQKENLISVGDFWDSLRYQDVHLRILNFENTNKKNLSNQKIHDLLMKTITFHDIFVFPESTVCYPKGRKFYRARKVFQADIHSAQDLVSGWTNKDFWEPPASSVSQIGRLNYKNESMLYLANTFPLCLLEGRAKENEFYVISQFINRNEINLTPIGLPYSVADMPPLSDHATIIGNQFVDFFRREFSRDVGKGTEWLYQSSNVIAKDFFDLPEPVSHGWIYPSMQDHNGLNICMRPHLGHEDFVLDVSILIQMISIEGNNVQFRTIGAKKKDSNVFILY